jgi:hypothetical protein
MSAEKKAEPTPAIEQPWHPSHPWCGGKNTELVRLGASKWMVYRCLDCPGQPEFEVDGE